MSQCCSVHHVMWSQAPVHAVLASNLQCTVKSSKHPYHIQGRSSNRIMHKWADLPLKQASPDGGPDTCVASLTNKSSLHAALMLCCLVQTDSDALARKRGRFLLQRATGRDAESEGWGALLHLLGLLEDFAQHLIKVLLHHHGLMLCYSLGAVVT